MTLQRGSEIFLALSSRIQARCGFLLMGEKDNTKANVYGAVKVQGTFR